MEKEILKQRISVLEKENKSLKLKNEASENFIEDYIHITSKVCDEETKDKIACQLTERFFNEMKRQIHQVRKNEYEKERPPIASVTSDIKEVIQKVMQEVVDKYELDDVEIEVTVKKENR